MIFWSNTFLINSSCSNKFLSASVCCVISHSFLTWNRWNLEFNWKVLVAATVFVNAAAISAAIAVDADDYCKVSTIATLFANAAAVTAAIAELALLLWVLPLPLPLPSCGGLFQSSCCCCHRIWKCRCHQCRCHIYVRCHSHCCCLCRVAVAAVAPPSPLCNILLHWLQM